MPVKLKAGKLSVLYEDGALRHILAENVKVLHMIYFNIRDHNWNTVEKKIYNEIITRGENQFSISYDCLFEQDDIKMTWHVNIEGREDSTIRFNIHGKALSTFYKNRAGLCILHSIEENKGKPVKLFHDSGDHSEGIFPEHVSPYEPFSNLSSMQWRPSNNSLATLHFEGDIFETEDQRNWTDNSYKTYCTPSSLPIPALLKVDEEVRQSVTLTYEGHLDAETIETGQVRIHINFNDPGKFPFIGVGKATEKNSRYLDALTEIAKANFGHYRVDVVLNSANWEQVLKEAVTEARHIGIQLELALFVSQNSATELEKLVGFDFGTVKVKSIILLEATGKCPASSLTGDVIPVLRKKFPGTRIGAGTDLDFVELNRTSLPTNIIDFVSYSIHPQAHAFDDLTLIENMEAQKYTVFTAWNIFRLPVHVSPVTLKNRYVPGNEGVPSPDNKTPPADSRQETLFGAGWTLGSLKYLIESGAESVTYYETVGARGLLKQQGDDLVVFPLMEIFKKVNDRRYTHFLKSSCNMPVLVTSFILCNESELCLLVANHSKEPVSFHFPALNLKKVESLTARGLDELNSSFAGTNDHLQIEGEEILFITIQKEENGLPY